MPSFTFKPALLRAPRSYLLEAGVLHASEGGRALWSLPLADVTGAVYVEHRAYGVKMRRLDLLAGETRRSLSQSLGLRTDPGDPELAAFRGLLAAVCEGMASAGTGATVRFGEHGRGRWAIFAIGAASVLFAIGLTVAALAGGIASSRLAEGLVPVAMMVLFGGALMWTTRPGRPVAELPADVAARVLAAL